MLESYIMAWWNARYPAPRYARLRVFEASGIREYWGDNLSREVVEAAFWLRANDPSESFG